MRPAGILLAMAALAEPGAAKAACPIELAVYGESSGEAEVEFIAGKANALVTNSFRMLLDRGSVLDGFVMWSEGIERPWGRLGYKCPEGDVTGEEIAACTAWEGVIYAVDAKGEVSLLPSEGEPAPQTLLFAGLGLALVHSRSNTGDGFTEVPFDAFTLKGCQE